MEPENKEVVKENVDYIAKMNELLNLNEIADLLKSNEKMFEVEGITYRIKKPNFKQKQDVYKKRIEKYTEFLKDEKYLLVRDLIELYKKRGINIDKMDLDLKNKMRKRDEFMVKLGEEIKNSSPDSTLQLLKKEIENANDEIQNLSIEKSTLLEYSIEQQINIFMYSYFTFVLAEKRDGENWVKVWNTLEEYEDGNIELINRFSYYITMMVGQDSF